jgi:hypothetical protein
VGPNTLALTPVDIVSFIILQSSGSAAFVTHDNVHCFNRKGPMLDETLEDVDVFTD